jgi:hypothetical protein
MHTLKRKIRNRIRIFRWWLVTHQLAWKSLVTLSAILAIATVVWQLWGWINKNSPALTFIATISAGIALAIFAWLTYRLSNIMVEYQYAAPIQLYSISEPEAGMIMSGAIEYKGLFWKICLLNVGIGPIWIDNIDIEVSRPTGIIMWTSVGLFSLLLDKNGDIVNPKKPQIIDGHGDISFNIVLHSPEIKEHLQRVFGKQDRFIMRILVYQPRQMKGYKSGWLDLVSSQFIMPQEFGQISWLIVPVS